MSAVAAANDPMRAYFVMLRKEQRLSQNAVADGSGVKRRTYIAWENGETEKLDIDVARSIVGFLGGAFTHLETIHLKTAEEAGMMAREWLRLSPEERLEAQRAAAALERIAAHIEGDPAKLQEVLRTIRERARENPALARCGVGVPGGA